MRCWLEGVGGGGQGKGWGLEGRLRYDGEVLVQVQVQVVACRVWSAGERNLTWSCTGDSIPYSDHTNPLPFISAHEEFDFIQLLVQFPPLL